jgi:hypothetical protein
MFKISDSKTIALLSPGLRTSSKEIGNGRKGGNPRWRLEAANRDAKLDRSLVQVTYIDIQK